MAQSFEAWTASLAEMTRIDTLRGSVIGLEAAEFLNHLDDFSIPDINRPIKEALLPALGGLPFGLKSVIRLTIKAFTDHGITPFFVFSGMDIDDRDNRENTFATSTQSANIIQQAWDLYQNGDNTGTVELFKKSGAVTPKHLFRYLQSILRDEGIGFIVAPYGAWAQLTYLFKSKAIDAIYGSPEILLFDVPEVITLWNLKAGDFTWVRRQVCISDLNVTPEIFIDACLLSGTSLLPTFPPLESNQRKPVNVKTAVDMIRSMGNSGYAVCLQYKDETQSRQMKYLDRYRKARLAVKHHVYMNEDGKVESLDMENAPFDVHEFISSRLQDEIYFFLSKGIIGPRLLNWMTSEEIIESQPVDNGEALEYRNLIKDKLLPARSTSLAVLSTTLHRFYQHKKVKLRCWFEDSSDQEIAIADLDKPTSILSSWNCHENIYGLEKNKYWGKSGTIGIAVKVLSNDSIAKETVTKKDPNNLLDSKEEILLNTVWRMLHIRGYINNDHTLTKWGKVLNTTLRALPNLPPEKTATLVELEEAAVVAVELARLGLLTSSNMFPMYTGAPYSDDETVNRNTLLISRIACLGKFSHQEIGYTGPLSRHFLGYNSMATAVRESLRDLAEVCLVNLLFNGDAVRNRDDYGDLGFDLPFLLSPSCALGLAVNAYFMGLTVLPEPTSAETKKKFKNKAPKELFEFASDYAGDLDKAFALWDAVYAGIIEAGDLVKERAIFDEADAWLEDLR